MKTNDIKPETLDGPYAMVYATSVKIMPIVEGAKQQARSNRAYFPTLTTGYNFIYLSDTQKGTVYKHTTGNIEHKR